MSELTPDDVLHWDLAVIDQIFTAATNLHGAHHQLGEALSDARQRTADWHGQGGDAFRTDLGKTRADIDASGQESKGVAAAVQRAEADVRYCQGQMREIDATARGYGWAIRPDWVVDDSLANAEGRKHDSQLLQNQLNQVKARAVAADHELATAVRAAVGEAQVDEQGNETTRDRPRDAGSEQRPGVTDVNDPGVKWQPGFDPEAWKNSWQNPLLSDNPPGYTGGPGPERDAAWQHYLAGFPKGERGFLPNPDAVDDPGLKVLGNAATQLGTSYAWGGKGLNGPGKGTLEYDPQDGGAHIYGDDKRVGFDCSGLAEYAAWQTGHADIGAGTGSQIDSPNLTTVAGGTPLKPGDFVYYGPGSAHHVGIYVAPGVILNAPESGLPVQLNLRSTTIGPDPVDGIVRARHLP